MRIICSGAILTGAHQKQDMDAVPHIWFPPTERHIRQDDHPHLTPYEGPE